MASYVQRNAQKKTDFKRGGNDCNTGKRNIRRAGYGAKAGHKIDAIKKCAKASFCVIEQDNIVPEEYTTYFRSVIAFGKIHIIEDEKEMRKAITALAIKYHPDDNEINRENAINREWKPLCMIEFEIEHITGKEAIELVRLK